MIGFTNLCKLVKAVTSQNCASAFTTIKVHTQSWAAVFPETQNSNVPLPAKI